MHFLECQSFYLGFLINNSFNLRMNTSFEMSSSYEFSSKNTRATSEIRTLRGSSEVIIKVHSFNENIIIIK